MQGVQPIIQGIVAYRIGAHVEDHEVGRLTAGGVDRCVLDDAARRESSVFDIGEGRQEAALTKWRRVDQQHAHEPVARLPGWRPAEAFGGGTARLSASRPWLRRFTHRPSTPRLQAAAGGRTALLQAVRRSVMPRDRGRHRPPARSWLNFPHSRRYRSAIRHPTFHVLTQRPQLILALCRRRHQKLFGCAGEAERLIP